jgi:zinc protease
VANAVLGGGSSGRLFDEVRNKRALSYGATSSLPQRMDASVLTAASQTKNESAAEVAQIMLTELARIGKEPVPADVTAKRIQFLTGSYTRNVETSGGLGGVLAGLIQQGLSPAEAARFVERMEAVTPQGLNAVAGRIANADRATLVVVGDSSKFLPALRALRPNVEVIPINDLDLESPTLRKGG